MAEDTVAMDTSITALSHLVDDVMKITREVSTELRRLHSDVQDIPAIKTVFVHARSYYIKIHSLAQYIYNEESYTIKAVEESNTEEFEDYIKEVLSKGDNCLKDINDLIKFTEEELVDEIVPQRNDGIQPITLIRGIGIGTALGLISGIALDQLRSNEDREESVSCLMIVLIAAVFGSIAGGVVAMVHHHYKQQSVQAPSYRSLKENTAKYNFEAIYNRLQIAVSQLRSTVNASVTHPQSQGSRPTKSTLVQAIREVTVQAKGLKEYCQPLKDAPTLDEFISCFRM